MTDSDRLSLGPELPVMITRAELLQIAAKLILGYTEEDTELQVSLFLLPTDDKNKRVHVPLSFVADELDVHNFVGEYFAKITGYPRFSPEYERDLENFKDQGNEVHAEIYLDDAEPSTNNLTGRLSVYMQQSKDQQ